jgi:hypothetical protein
MVYVLNHCQGRFLVQKQDLTYLVILEISRCYLQIIDYL